MPDINQEILLALLGTKKSFRALQKETGISPRILRKYLDSLINRSLVNEEGSQAWRRGRKLFYSLTPFGNEYTFKTAVESISAIVKTLHKIVKSLANDPQLLRQTLDIVSFSFVERSRNTPLIQEEITALYSKYNLRVNQPLLESLRMLYETYLEVHSLPPLKLSVKDYFIGFPKDGSPYLIPMALLKKHGVGAGF